jgi:hypothetical protein
MPERALGARRPVRYGRLVLRVDDHGRKFDGSSNGGTMKVELDVHFAASTG